MDYDMPVGTQQISKARVETAAVNISFWIYIPTDPEDVNQPRRHKSSLALRLARS